MKMLMINLGASVVEKMFCQLNERKNRRSLEKFSLRCPGLLVFVVFVSFVGQFLSVPVVNLEIWGKMSL